MSCWGCTDLLCWRVGARALIRHHLHSTRPDTIANRPGIEAASGCSFPGQATLVCAPRPRNTCGHLRDEDGNGTWWGAFPGRGCRGPFGAGSCSCSASAQEAGEDASSWSRRSPCRAGRGVKAGLQPGHLCTSFHLLVFPSVKWTAVGSEAISLCVLI